MSVIGEVKASLDAIGAEQQVCLFVFLISYPLALGALLEGRGKRVAAFTALAAAIGFVATTSPWMHAVMLIVLLVGCVGLLIATVYLLDAAHRAVAREALVPALLAEEAPPAMAAPAAGRERIKLREPATAKP